MTEQITGPTEECHWVLPGRVLVGEYPGSRTNKSVDIKRVSELVKAGADFSSRATITKTNRVGC